MNIKQKISLTYLAIGLVYMLSTWHHVSDAFTENLALNLGRGMSWPGHIFPTVGHFTGGFVWLAASIAALVFLKK